MGGCLGCVSAEGAFKDCMCSPLYVKVVLVSLLFARVVAWAERGHSQALKTVRSPIQVFVRIEMKLPLTPHKRAAQARARCFSTNVTPMSHLENRARGSRYLQSIWQLRSKRMYAKVCNVLDDGTESVMKCSIVVRPMESK